MVSSTFTDLEKHRQFVKEAIEKLDFKAEVMESSGANASGDVIATSLDMVEAAAAYIGLISHKYGQIPVDPVRNPKGLSITELEFERAEQLDRPRLLFIMSDNHPVRKQDVETDPEKIAKLNAFRERAKAMRPGGMVHRIYEIFEDEEDLARKAGIAIGKLAKLLEPPPPPPPPPPGDVDGPLPPDLRAMPPYRGSHPFVGRAAQLATLHDWSDGADPNPLLLFEAMGGSGKSLLTWYWLNELAPQRREWAGRFWYSFYERGAQMGDFCRQALSYMTGRPAEDFARQPQSKLSRQLLAHLNAKPWLLVLDGLERVLVAYHRHDAAQMRDEEADSATDQIAKRDPCRAIRREDDDLLAMLAAAAPSKLLISSRLTPVALLSSSNTPITGVRLERLPGLRPEDAEAMMRACGIKGDGAAMRAWLQSNCDCHPLVTGVIAGLVNRNARAPGDFDKWLADPKGGGALNLGALNLVQRRNHILTHAIEGIDGDDRLVLQLLALFPRAADYEVLLALAERNGALDDDRLSASIGRLRERGLIQYDDGNGYDLHPVVRGVVAGRMDKATTEAVGEALVDHFMAVPHNPWEHAQTLEDVEAGIDLVTLQLRMGRYEKAFYAFAGDLEQALLFNLEATLEMQQLLKPFFPGGWDTTPVKLRRYELVLLLNSAASSLHNDHPDQAMKLYVKAISLAAEISDYTLLKSVLINFTVLLGTTGKLALNTKFLEVSLRLAERIGKEDTIFRSKFDWYINRVIIGDLNKADVFWDDIKKMGQNWSRHIYRPGDIEIWHARDMFYRGILCESTLIDAEQLAEQGRNRWVIQHLKHLRGLWYLDHDACHEAVASFDVAITMEHERGRENSEAEAWRALACLRLGRDAEARTVAQRLGSASKLAAVALAELWYELGDPTQSISHALRAHKWAVADGEPYVRRYWLDRVRTLLVKMSEPLPDIPVYDPTSDPPFAWEADVQAVIEKLHAENDDKPD